MSAPLLSIIVPAFNEEAFLPKCLARIRAAFGMQARLSDAYEIIVCDNNSSDRTAAIALEHGCRVVFEPVNHIGRARNAGASMARGEWLLFVDADCWPPPGLVADLENVLGDECIGCGATIHIVDGPWWFRRAWQSKNLSMRLFKWCPGGFLLCRKTAFERLGGFDLQLFIFEEADFVKRLKALGRARKQRFVILHRHPFCASGRKGSRYGFWSWLGTALRFWASPSTCARDRDFAAKWYDSRGR
jgi:glycosyltransferase involved in cell wall biosynthesis